MGFEWINGWITNFMLTGTWDVRFLMVGKKE